LIVRTRSPPPPTGPASPKGSGPGGDRQPRSSPPIGDWTRPAIRPARRRPPAPPRLGGAAAV